MVSYGLVKGKQREKILSITKFTLLQILTRLSGFHQVHIGHFFAPNVVQASAAKVNGLYVYKILTLLRLIALLAIGAQLFLRSTLFSSVGVFSCQKDTNIV